jgi:RNA polymerase sigma-70 factor, ECF subfamily
MDDHSLVRQCIQGDADAYRHIVDRYRDQIARVIATFGARQADVEDLTQDVFIKAYRSLNRFNFDSSLHTWLYRIAVNHTIDYLRKKKAVRLLSLEGLDEWVLGRLRGTTHAPDALPEELRHAENSETVRWALDQIAKDSKRILILREFEELSYEEIADILGISLSAVKSRLYRARSELKEVLAPLL